jgi:hypothetical protein
MSAKTTGSYAVIRWAREQKVRNPRRKLILVDLATYADQDGYCWPGQKTLAEHAECSRSTATRHIGVLADEGKLTIEHRHRADGARSTNGYRLAFDQEPMSTQANMGDEPKSAQSGHRSPEPKSTQVNHPQSTLGEQGMSTQVSGGSSPKRDSRSTKTRPHRRANANDHVHARTRASENSFSEEIEQINARIVDGFVSSNRKGARYAKYDKQDEQWLYETYSFLFECKPAENDLDAVLTYLAETDEWPYVKRPSDLRDNWYELCSASQQSSNAGDQLPGSDTDPGNDLPPGCRTVEQLKAEGIPVYKWNDESRYKYNGNNYPGDEQEKRAAVKKAFDKPEAGA